MSTTISAPRVLLLALLLSVPVAASADAVDPAPAPLTRADLARLDAFWPYHVRLVEPWQPPGAEEPLRADVTGVLVRVEPTGVARIDLGRHGVREVPIDRTDLLEQANRIRRGQADHEIPNLIAAIGPRLQVPNVAHDKGLWRTVSEGKTHVLCAFADPEAPGFEALARELAPLSDREALLTAFFPQGRGAAGAALRQADWLVPYADGAYTRGYTRSLGGAEQGLPSVMLFTVQGRLLYRGGWKPGVADEIRAALRADAGEAPSLSVLAR
jgi:hypothetical protein